MCNRPSWDEYFMNIAELASSRSTCIRRQIGAVAVKNNRILCTSYNGAPPNIEHCTKVGCVREIENIPSGTRHERCMAIHAEQNLIIQAALHGINLNDCTVYCTNQPCIICMKMIIGIHPEKLVFKNPYPDEYSIELLSKVAHVDIYSTDKDFITWKFFNWI